MRTFHALWRHIWLVLQFKHHGEGLPKEKSGAIILASVYVICTLLHKASNHTLSLETWIGLLFIVQIYIFLLRNPVVGLILLVGIAANLIGIILLFVTQISDTHLITAFLEYIMIFFGILNIISQPQTK